MSEIKIFAKYGKGDLWTRKMPDGTYKVGITDYAQDQLGAIAYIELPDEGDIITQDVSMGSIESGKAVSPLISPISGTIKAVNEAAIDDPEIVNNSPYDLGWLVEVEPSNWEADYARLMSADEYRDYLETR